MKILEFSFTAAEFLAALVGIIYIYKYRVDNATRYFVYFLCFSFFVELLGELPTLIKNNESLDFLNNTLLAKNAWFYNIYTIISILFYVCYFKYYLKSRYLKNILNILLLVFLLSSIVNLIITDVFFVRQSSYVMVFGTFLILISVFFYFFEMLKSEKILEFNKDFVFYVGVGASIFHLCITPLFIYFRYFHDDISPEFVQIHKTILYTSIIFMYTCFTIGFLVCFKKNKSY
ncbi:hypothetical protein D1818_23375 [Aquimarina sp. BL5]|nr:hypothetical protein D1818_23375 [Aquimarina sp. BL5]RKM97626.1 hypothetical protein D7036_20495 [Aquimarina sp. BL5]